MNQTTQHKKRRKNAQTIWQTEEEDKVESKLAEVVDIWKQKQERAKVFNFILSWQWGWWWYFDDDEKVFCLWYQTSY